MSSCGCVYYIGMMDPSIILYVMLSPPGYLYDTSFLALVMYPIYGWLTRICVYS
jgi:hypothetical protein